MILFLWIYVFTIFKWCLYLILYNLKFKMYLYTIHSMFERTLKNEWHMHIWHNILSTNQISTIKPISISCQLITYVGAPRNHGRYIYQPCPSICPCHNKLSKCYLPGQLEQANTWQLACHSKFAKMSVKPMGLVTACVIYHNCQSLHFETTLVFKWNLCEKVSRGHPTCNVPSGYLGPQCMLPQHINVMENIK